MIKNLFSDDDPAPEEGSKPTGHTHSSAVITLFDSAEQTDDKEFTVSQSEPESMAETVRRSGLAYSAGIAFTAAVVFMLILGWGADVLLGTSPWGIVVGIVIGSIIGFVQLFRLTSQIFKS